MKVKFAVPYRSTGERYEVPPWPKGWPPPSVGDVIYTGDEFALHVRHVSWYPSTTDEEGHCEPFVYVSLSDRPDLLR